MFPTQSCGALRCCCCCCCRELLQSKQSEMSRAEQEPTEQRCQHPQQRAVRRSLGCRTPGGSKQPTDLATLQASTIPAIMPSKAGESFTFQTPYHAMLAGAKAAAQITQHAIIGTGLVCSVASPPPSSSSIGPNRRRLLEVRLRRPREKEDRWVLPRLGDQQVRPPRSA